MYPSLETHATGLDLRGASPPAPPLPLPPPLPPPAPRPAGAASAQGDHGPKTSLKPWGPLLAQSCSWHERLVGGAGLGQYSGSAVAPRLSRHVRLRACGRRRGEKRSARLGRGIGRRRRRRRLMAEPALTHPHPSSVVRHPLGPLHRRPARAAHHAAAPRRGPPPPPPRLPAAAAQRAALSIVSGRPRVGGRRGRLGRRLLHVQRAHDAPRGRGEDVVRVRLGARWRVWAQGRGGGVRPVFRVDWAGPRARAARPPAQPVSPARAAPPPKPAPAGS
jgi:hypothetical protein